MENNIKLVYFAQKEIKKFILLFTDKVNEMQADRMANDVVNKIDWNNSALMHKGFSWMAKNCLESKNLL